MIDLVTLQEDKDALSRILDAQRAVSTETLPAGVRLLWGAYLLILEDAIKTLGALIAWQQKQDTKRYTDIDSAR